MSDPVAVGAVTHAHLCAVPGVALDAEPGCSMYRMAHITSNVRMSRMLSYERLLDDRTVASGTLTVVVLIKLDRFGLVWVVTTGAVQCIRTVRQSVAVAALGQVAVLDVAVIALECRMHAPALFDAFVLRDMAGAASAAVQTWIVDPFHRRMWVRMADRAIPDGCTVRLRVTSLAVWQVAMLDVAEGAVQRRMFAASILQRMILWCMAVHALNVSQILRCAFIRRRHG